MENPLEEFKILHQQYTGGFDYQTKELAEFVGVSTRTIQRWMRGKTSPSEDELKKIQAYLSSKKSRKSNIEI